MSLCASDLQNFLDRVDIMPYTMNTPTWGVWVSKIEQEGCTYDYRNEAF